MQLLADVLTPANVWNSEQPLLTYTVPPELQNELQTGQLIAVPYGDRLVEGIVWNLWEDDGAEQQENKQQKTGLYTNHESPPEYSRGDPRGRPGNLRPISTILDPEPAQLPHQRALAEWMAAYYVTPLAQVAVKMLPPGLMQRSKVVLHLINGEDLAINETQDKQALTRHRALIGLLLADGEIDIERLKQMLGPKQAKEIIQEALSSGII